MNAGNISSMHYEGQNLPTALNFCHAFGDESNQEELEVEVVDLRNASLALFDLSSQVDNSVSRTSYR